MVLSLKNVHARSLIAPMRSAIAYVSTIGPLIGFGLERLGMHVSKAAELCSSRTAGGGCPHVSLVRLKWQFNAWALNIRTTVATTKLAA